MVDTETESAKVAKKGVEVDCNSAALSVRTYADELIRVLPVALGLALALAAAAAAAAAAAPLPAAAAAAAAPPPPAAAVPSLVGPSLSLAGLLALFSLAVLAAAFSTVPAPDLPWRDYCSKYQRAIVFLLGGIVFLLVGACLFSQLCGAPSLQLGFLLPLLHALAQDLGLQACVFFCLSFSPLSVLLLFSLFVSLRQI